MAPQNKKPQDLLLNQTRYKELLDNLTAGVVVHAPDTSIIYSNPQAAHILGLSTQHMKGKEAIDPQWQLTDENKTALPIEAYPVNLILSSKKKISNLLIGINRPQKNDFVWCLVNGFPVFDNKNKLQEVIINFIDITERKEAQQRLQNSHEELENRVADRTAALKKLSGKFLDALEDDRKRIALELHDSIGQRLTAIKFKLEVSVKERSMLDIKNHTAELNEIIAYTQESIEEIRRISMNLRPSILDHMGIITTIDWFCQEFKKIYSEVSVIQALNLTEAEIPDNIKIVIFRIMQESFNNIAKHSQADRIEISISKNKGHLELKISDNGIGFDLKQLNHNKDRLKGFGLVNMRERAEFTQAQFKVQSQQGQGTSLSVAWRID